MQFTLKQKILIVFGMLLLITAFICIQSMRRFDQLGKSIDVILSENYRSVIACQQMKDSLERIDSGLLFILAGFTAEGRNQIDVNLKRFNTELGIELNNLTLPEEPKEAFALKSLFNQYSQELPRFLSNRALGLEESYFKTLFPLFLKMKSKADTILQMNQTNMNEANNRARIKASKASRDMVLFLVISSFIALLFLLFSNRWILKPIRRLIDSTMEIRQGNLNLVINVDTQDEIGQLSEAFNAMVASLRIFKRSDQAKLERVQWSIQEAFKHIPAAIGILDVDGRVEFASQSARANFGLEPDFRITDTPYPWLADLFRDTTNDMASQDKGKKHGVIQHFVGNQERFFQPRAIPIMDNEKDLCGLIIFLEDVTLERQNDEIKKNLFSTVSHQLKTPLTSIRMALHLLLEEKIGSINEKQADLLVSARDESERLCGIIEDLLDISRIESGNTSIILASVSPHNLVEQTVQPFQRDAQDKGISLEVNVPEDLPDVLVDMSRIGHVFANLLSNAIKYTPFGGRITITAKPEKGKVRFLVSDTGKGIPAEYHSRIFEKFFRIPDPKAEMGEGLGLAIARGIVSAHGGEITFSSVVRKGTTFEFTLKRSESPDGGKKQ